MALAGAKHQLDKIRLFQATKIYIFQSSMTSIRSKIIKTEEFTDFKFFLISSLSNIQLIVIVLPV